ncbi:MAG: GNAT family N-acetyltransferase [Bacilli bacterium]|nr:GNAT family N-acetyltransferase [Bacilli bacterium]
MKNKESVINYNEIKFETERLIIRRIKKEDLQDYYEIMGDELTMNFLGRANTYAIECAKYMVDYAFNEIKLNRIEADCVKENEASLKIFK